MLSSITSQNNFLNPGAASPDLSFPEGAASDLPTWDKVNFQTLSSFERVSDQYQDWGLQFEGAIALTPSNPSFLSESDKVVLMPATGRKMIKIHLRRSIHHITIGVRGVGIVNFMALGKNGHCLTRCSLDGQQSSLTDNNTPAHLPQKQFDLAAQQLAVLILKSDAPFIIESLFITF
ncbi:MAG: hypothetical protein MJA27_27635 [Pseudanabaenales cyanobacterium]|nr:hypothetical protein [Pseudanabaenales cyanobacterium]